MCLKRTSAVPLLKFKVSVYAFTEIVGIELYFVDSMFSRFNLSTDLSNKEDFWKRFLKIIKIIQIFSKLNNSEKSEKFENHPYSRNL